MVLEISIRLEDSRCDFHEDFSGAIGGRGLEGFLGIIERVDCANQGARIDHSLGERGDGLGKRAASRADDLDLVDDDGGEVHGIVPGDGCFQDDRPAWLNNLEGRREAGRRASTIGDDVENPAKVADFVEGVSENAFSRRGQLLGMLADQVNMGTEEAGDPGAKEAELAVAENGDGNAGAELDLFGDPECGGQRFDEYGRLVIDRIRNFMKIAGRDGHEVGHRSVVVENPENGSMGTMVGMARLANWATPASVIDLGDDSFSVVGLSDELVAKYAFESHVAARELNVGITDSDEADLENDLVSEQLGFDEVVAKLD